MTTNEGLQYSAHVAESSDFLLRTTPFRPTVCVVLGSGLGGLKEELTERQEVNFADIPHFAEATVSGHAGKLIFGKFGTLAVVLLEGRTHLYEGYPAKTVAFPTRVLGAMGVKSFVITNSAGGINPELRIGDIMLITDHIAMFCDDPTEGVYHPTLGPLFYDMSQPYDKELQTVARQAAAKHFSLKEGTYFYYRQSGYETPAEIRMMHRLGGDVVGKSTAPEVLAARQMQCSVLGLTFVSSQMTEGAPLTHEEVLAAGKAAAPKFHAFLTRILGSLANR
jgi:purine-nucleoside phosphorylase